MWRDKWNLQRREVLNFLIKSDEIVLDSTDACAVLKKISSVIDTFDSHSASNLQSEFLVIRTLFQTLSLLAAFSFSLCFFLVISPIIKWWVAPGYSSWFLRLLNMCLLTWVFLPISSHQVPHSDTCFKEKKIYSLIVNSNIALQSGDHLGSSRSFPTIY